MAKKLFDVQKINSQLFEIMGIAQWKKFVYWIIIFLKSIQLVLIIKNIKRNNIDYE